MNRMALLVVAWLAAAPVHAATACYQKSDLSLFGDVVEVVAVEQMKELGCWQLRLRLRAGHAMICGGNACGSGSDLVEGIYWLDRSPGNLNVGQVMRFESRSCTDVSFNIVPANQTDVMWVDFVALFEEAYFVPPSVLRPRWSRGLIGFSSFDNRSHCQDDGDPRGSICLEP